MIGAYGACPQVYGLRWSGQLIVPLEVRITGNPDGIFPLLEQCNLKSEKPQLGFEYTVLLIHSDANV